MSNQSDILKYFSSIHAGFIHAKGAAATLKMKEILDIGSNENVLEIGHGTATTMIEMASANNATFNGLDISEEMHHTACKRINYCSLNDRFHLQLIKKSDPLPFAENTFDKVYIESMLAILELPAIKQLFIEIKRVLKPKGKFAFNETIWLNDTSKITANRINKACKETYGIIQSNSELLHLKDWIELCKKFDFNINSITHLNELPSDRLLNLNKKSKRFTQLGKIRSLFSYKYRRIWHDYQSKMKQILPNDHPLMEGVIIELINIK